MVRKESGGDVVSDLQPGGKPRIGKKRALNETGKQAPSLVPKDIALVRDCHIKVQRLHAAVSNQDAVVVGVTFREKDVESLSQELESHAIASFRRHGVHSILHERDGKGCSIITFAEVKHLPQERMAALAVPIARGAEVIAFDFPMLGTSAALGDLFLEKVSLQAQVVAVKVAPIHQGQSQREKAKDSRLATVGLNRDRVVVSATCFINVEYTRTHVRWPPRFPIKEKAAPKQGCLAVYRHLIVLERESRSAAHTNIIVLIGLFVKILRIAVSTLTCMVLMLLMVCLLQKGTCVQTALPAVGRILSC